MSYLLEILGRGLDKDLSDLLDRYFWSPPSQSLSQLEDCCRQHPDWPDIRFQLGLVYLRSMQIPEAIEHLSEACKYKCDYLAARLALASAYDQEGRSEKALDHLKIANQTHAGEPAVLFAMGFCLEKLRQPLEAAEYYRDTIAAKPYFLPARERLAAIATLLDDTETAIEQYQFLRDAEPEKTYLRAALAHLYHRDGSFDKAVEEFESAIAMEPENWALADDEVESLVAEGLIREAIERLHMLIEQQGEFADLHVRLADLYSQSSDDEATLHHYQIALDLQPNYLEAKVKLGAHHLLNGRWDEAAETFHNACELNDRVMVNYIGIGVAQAAAGRTAEAMNSFDLAATVEPNSTLLLTEMARLQLKASLADEFIKNFEPSNAPAATEIELDNDDLLHRQVERHGEEIASNPNHADLRYRYGVLLRSEGRLAEALEQFSAATEINPNYTQAVIKLGITQQELGQVEEAVQTFIKALDLAPAYVDLHYRLGLLYTNKREFEEAIKHMESASEGAPDNKQIRAALALSLQNMGLMDKAAATWRSLWKLHHAKTS